jgi:ubiquinol-cytochrome c reductase cytochrome b subunit
LRAIPNKIGGVIAMISAILILFIVPFIDKVDIKNPHLKIFHKFLFCIFSINFLLLGFLGGNPAEMPFIILSQICTFIYFSFFIVLFFFSVLEKFLNKIFFIDLYGKEDDDFSIFFYV